MKKVLAIILALVMVLSFAACGKKQEAVENVPEGWEEFAELIKAAREEGELVVYGGCEEEYLSAVCQKYEELFGVKVSHQRLSTSEILAKVQEENGNPSADVSFGGTTDPYNEMVLADLLDVAGAVEELKDHDAPVARCAGKLEVEQLAPVDWLGEPDAEVLERASDVDHVHAAGRGLVVNLDRGDAIRADEGVGAEDCNLVVDDYLGGSAEVLHRVQRAVG